jgi:hypothetical protein
MRFHFQAEDGRIYPDDQGVELPNVRAACVEASRILGDFLKRKPEEFWVNDDLSLRVSDDRGLVLFTLNLSVSLSAAMAGRHPDI